MNEHRTCLYPSLFDIKEVDESKTDTESTLNYSPDNTSNILGDLTELASNENIPSRNRPLYKNFYAGPTVELHTNIPRDSVYSVSDLYPRIIEEPPVYKVPEKVQVDEQVKNSLKLEKSGCCIIL
jgi:hypothetical protein